MDAVLRGRTRLYAQSRRTHDRPLPDPQWYDQRQARRLVSQLGRRLASRRGDHRRDPQAERVCDGLRRQVASRAFATVLADCPRLRPLLRHSLLKRHGPHCGEPQRQSGILGAQDPVLERSLDAGRSHSGTSGRSDDDHATLHRQGDRAHSGESGSSVLRLSAPLDATRAALPLTSLCRAQSTRSLRRCDRGD